MDGQKEWTFTLYTADLDVAWTTKRALSSAYAFAAADVEGDAAWLAFQRKGGDEVALLQLGLADGDIAAKALKSSVDPDALVVDGTHVWAARVGDSPRLVHLALHNGVVTEVELPPKAALRRIGRAGDDVEALLETSRGRDRELRLVELSRGRIASALVVRGDAEHQPLTAWRAGERVVGVWGAGAEAQGVYAAAVRDGSMGAPRFHEVDDLEGERLIVDRAVAHGGGVCLAIELSELVTYEVGVDGERVTGGERLISALADGPGDPLTTYRTVVEFHLRHVLLAELSADGDLAWTRTIPVRESVSSEPGSRVAVGVDGEEARVGWISGDDAMRHTVTATGVVYADPIDLHAGKGRTGDAGGAWVGGAWVGWGVAVDDEGRARFWLGSDQGSTAAQPSTSSR